MAETTLSSGPVRTLRLKAPDGVTLVGDVMGDSASPTVVLLHGGGQTRHSWSGAMHALAARGYHVISYDARGHGDSGWSHDGDYRFTVRASDLRTVLGDKCGPFALVGASLGGATSMQAIREGLRPEALVLVDIVARPALKGINRIIAFMTGHIDGFATLQDASDAIAAYNPSRSRPISFAGLQKNLRQDADGRYRWHWDPRMLEGEAGDPAQLERTIEGSNWGREIPTLLVRGLHSDVVTDEGVEHLREHIPALEVLNVAGAGHMVAGDRNDAFNDGVIDYLARHMPAPRA